ncbi:MAG TPA: type II toxin-antitoxin system HicB family antitoxin [Longimicrobium sp.]|nr:type II toxin-antitoxin system HicB family antitoxin [Longimicrobium sp.]
MEYKGYTAWYEADEYDGVLHGHVADIRDVVTFESETLEGLEREFHVSVDDYLAFCSRDGVDPEQPTRRASPRP